MSGSGSGRHVSSATLYSGTSTLSPVSFVPQNPSRQMLSPTSTTPYPRCARRRRRGTPDRPSRPPPPRRNFQTSARAFFGQHVRACPRSLTTTDRRADPFPRPPRQACRRWMARAAVAAGRKGLHPKAATTTTTGQGSTTGRAQGSRVRNFVWGIRRTRGVAAKGRPDDHPKI